MIDWIKNLFNRDPPMDAVPNQTGAAVGMDYWIASMCENTEVPKKGDVVIRLVTDGMGAAIRNDIRYRVTGPGPYRRSVYATTKHDALEVLHVFYMRRHQTLPRTWVLMD